jgi:tetratricopeptide (TPR) repeat protein
MKKIQFLVFVLLIQTVSFCQNTFKDAKFEYLHGDMNKSIEMFTKLIDAKENLVDSYILRGAANLYLRNIELGFNDLNEAKKINSKNSELYYYFAYGYFLKADYKLVSENLENAIKENNKEARSYDLRSCLKITLGDFEGALKDSNLAIQYDDTDELFFSNRAFAKINLKLYDDAITDLEKSLEIKPTQKGFANKGLAYSFKEMYPMAINCFNKSLDINPNDGEVYYFRGICHVKLEKYDAACDDFLKSKELKYEAANKACEELKCN